MPEKAVDGLPRPDQPMEIARTAYKPFEQDPFNPKLDFHEIKGTKTGNGYAVSAGQYYKTFYRASGVWDKQSDLIVWFWIGETISQGRGSPAARSRSLPAN